MSKSKEINNQDDYIEDYVNKAQNDFKDYLKIFYDEFKVNNDLQLVYFHNNYSPFINNQGYNIEDLIKLITLNSNHKWVQLFDDKYLGFLKQNLDSMNNILIKDNDKQNCFEKMLFFQNNVIKEFYSREDSKRLYNLFSNFDALRDVKPMNIRDKVLYIDILKNNSKNSDFKPLNIKSWISFYEKILTHFFCEYRIIKNNSDIIILEKSIDENLNIIVEMDKKIILMNIKTDALIIPSLKTYFISSSIKKQFFYYLPYRNSLIAKSNEDIEFLKKYSFFILKTHFYINSKILLLLSNKR